MHENTAKKRLPAHLWKTTEKKKGKLVRTMCILMDRQKVNRHAKCISDCVIKHMADEGVSEITAVKTEMVMGTSV